MKIVVAGGTGFLGRHISRALLDAGHDVTVLGRNPGRVASITLLHGASSIAADVTAPQTLVGKLDGADAVVGCVQLPNYPVEQPRKHLTFDRYDRQGTENLLAEATRAGVGRYFYVSGVNVDTASDKTWYRAKAFAEDAIKRNGISFCILRPSWAYGPEDKALNRFAQIARLSPVVPKPGLGIQRIQPVYVDDIALAVRRIFERDDAWGRTLEIGGPEAMTMDEVIRTLLAVMGKRRLVVPIPASLLKVAMAPLVLLPKPPMSPGGIEFATQDGLADSAEMERVLDVHPVRLEEGLRRYIRG